MFWRSSVGFSVHAYQSKTKTEKPGSEQEKKYFHFYFKTKFPLHSRLPHPAYKSKIYSFGTQADWV